MAVYSLAHSLPVYGDQSIVPCSDFSFQELADIYNQTRVDYIVPMPMNARRMEDYVQHYDIDLKHSPISLNGEKAITGIGMLGMRGQRGWITRLGVIPERRGYKTGQLLMETMLQAAQAQGATCCQLEVIKGNAPAHHLFIKLGFAETRELLVIRRPPAPLTADPALDQQTITPLTLEEITQRLEAYDDEPSWVEEGRSVLQAGSLQGFQLADAQNTWVIYQLRPFQITHITFGTREAAPLHALLYHLHRQHPKQDTKIENVPVGSVAASIYQQMGYVESFRRIEMLLTF